MPLLTSDDDLRLLLSASRTIAVVGLSEHRYRDSYQVAAYLLNEGYRIIPVNPMASTVLGQQAFASLTAVADHVDIVDIFRRPEHVPAIVEDAIRIGASAVWMQFTTGHPAAAERASQAGLRVVVERCIMVEHRRLLL